jgi:hypothetical protein
MSDELLRDTTGCSSRSGNSFSEYFITDSSDPAGEASDLVDVGDCSRLDVLEKWRDANLDNILGGLCGSLVKVKGGRRWIGEHMEVPLKVEYGNCILHVCMKST